MFEQQLSRQPARQPQVKDELARIEGVGDVFLFGNRDYSMRVWLDPERDDRPEPVAGRGGGRDPQAERAGGRRADRPAAGPEGQNLQLVINTQGRLKTEQQFRDIVVKTGPERRGAGASSATSPGSNSGPGATTRRALDNRPAVGHAGVPTSRRPTPSARPATIKEKMQELRASPDWPDGDRVRHRVRPDRLHRGRAVNEVVQTLFEAILLVFVVVLVFLQNWRAALIPMIAVPVSLVGTLAAMYALGYSINNLTLFGMVLAIGIVVDDAIVVVEAVESHIAPRAVAAGGDAEGHVRSGDRRSSACRWCSVPCSCRPRSSPG